MEPQHECYWLELETRDGRDEGVTCLFQTFGNEEAEHVPDA